MAASTTLFGLMDLDTEQNKGTLKPATVSGEVAVKDVTFTYEGAEKPALDKVEFQHSKR